MTYMLWNEKALHINQVYTYLDHEHSIHITAPPPREALGHGIRILSWLLVWRLWGPRMLKFGLRQLLNSQA
jgi:hypothetical protein